MLNTILTKAKSEAFKMPRCVFMRIVYNNLTRICVAINKMF